MIKFVNRNKEYKFLEDEYNRDSSSLVILYGRRRVGKTALASEFIKEKNALYFLVTEESEAQNRLAFKNMTADFIHNNLLKNANIDNWDIIFQSILDYESNCKKVIVIDEFQNLGKSNSAFPSIFQKIWDTMLKDKNIMVILCGSLISMMESQTLNYTSPLYGRRTGQIKLKQIPFTHYHEFFPDKSRKELIEYYAITGGVPKYIELFYDYKDIYTAIEKNVISKSSFLYDEPNFLLQREVSEIGSYFSVIKTIAAGNEKLSKIAASLELKQTGLTKYLKTLINLDIIEREVPITEENPEKSKRGLYKINDNFMLFWFRFIYPNLSFIESGNDGLAMDKIRNNLIDRHVSYIYEDVCIEEMWNLNSAKKWNFYFDRVGRWWNNNTEIDIVAFDSTGNDIIFGECKYWVNKVGVDVLKSLEEKGKSVEWKKNNRKNWYIIFSINGFTDDLIELANNREDLLLWQ
ncbi:AAA+ ATPase superfamily predicted ATPase [Sedimentibacter acidaminivorans]|uniref:AAA+ ATPase superfamily predicted ATPase n=1 Tax=Sedimentibacter acidaminivorans TaxID=913099 RepID=A0ABS4G9L4_9FIRM|nr:ATP-binding protein [Sedimentibacter acidaminivorans]MBP1924237.1 AAA+ ATPase superfamily predicted ATPase [Sedimentibacter acidaminivorans]